MMQKNLRFSRCFGINRLRCAEPTAADTSDWTSRPWFLLLTKRCHWVTECKGINFKMHLVVCCTPAQTRLSAGKSFCLLCTHLLMFFIDKIFFVLFVYWREKLPRRQREMSSLDTVRWQNDFVPLPAGTPPTSELFFQATRIGHGPKLNLHDTRKWNEDNNSII